MMLKYAAILVWLFLPGIAAAGDGPGLRLEASLDRDQARVGEPVVYTLRVSAGPDRQVVFPDPASGRIGELEINSVAEKTGKDGARLQQFVLQGFEPGSFTLPPPEVTVRNEGGEEETLTGPPLEIEIVSVLDPAKEDADIHGLKDPVGIPNSYRWLLYPAAAAVLIAGAFLLYRKLSRRKKGGPSLPPPRPPDEIALEELERIRRADLPGRGLVKDYYSRVSDTVRRYLENRFRLRAPERTTEEFLQEMATTNHLTGPQQNLVAAFLEESDLVKFARYGPTEREIGAVFAAAVRLVEETGERKTGEVQSEEGKGR